MVNKFKLITWNVNGIRACTKNGFGAWLKKENPDVLCLQEIKASPEQTTETLAPFLKGYRLYVNSAERKGYSGVATLSRQTPVSVKQELGVPKFDSEGRLLATDFGSFILFNVYFPNGGRDLSRVGFKLEFYDRLLKQLLALGKKGKQLVVCGDFNTAHKEIDLRHPKANEKNTGFLPEERAWVDRYLKAGFVDIFRLFHPEPGQYTWWSYMFNARANNVGWRIDYHLVTEKMKSMCKNAYLLPEVKGSDHCPAVLEIAV